MGNVSNTNYPVLRQLKHCWSTDQSLFLYEWGQNFELDFCKTIEDKFNGDIPCIAHSAFLHACLKR